MHRSNAESMKTKFLNVQFLYHSIELFCSHTSIFQFFGSWLGFNAIIMVYRMKLVSLRNSFPTSAEQSISFPLDSQSLCQSVQNFCRYSSTRTQLWDTSHSGLVCALCERQSFLGTIIKPCKNWWRCCTTSNVLGQFRAVSFDFGQSKKQFCQSWVVETKPSARSKLEVPAHISLNGNDPLLAYFHPLEIS